MAEQDVNDRVEQLAKEMLAKKLAFSLTQARERAREIVMQEVSFQERFDKVKDDPSFNPQQRVQHVPEEELRKHGLLTGTELPTDVPLSELLKGRPKK